MSEQTKRQQLETHLTRRALEDPDFRDRLLKDPKVAIEEEIGLTFPEALNVVVHEERLNQLHVVLPVDLLSGADLVPSDTNPTKAEDVREGPFWKQH